MFDKPFDGTPHETDWTAVTNFFNGVSEVTNENLGEATSSLRVAVYSPALERTLEVSVPTRSVENFMRNLPMYEAEIYSGGPS